MNKADPESERPGKAAAPRAVQHPRAPEATLLDRRPWLAWVLIAASATAAYSSSFAGVYVFDDDIDIVQAVLSYPAWPIWRPLVTHSESGTNISPRPLAMLSFATNYWLGGPQPWSFHLVNLVIHILAGLILYGIVRRTMLLPSMERYAATASGLALAIALIWTLHPLQTQAVTYIVQRYESMMGLFYLFSLYAAIRAATTPHAAVWGAASVASCLAAMSCKEVAITAPVLILLYDRTFLSGSFRAAWRQHGKLIALLIGTWLICVPYYRAFSGGGPKGSFAGFAVPLTWYEYARSEPGVIVQYLRLSILPLGQCACYDWPVAQSLSEILPPLIAVGGPLLLTLWALARRPPWGFLGAWFFLILAPTSSVMPVNDLAFEHRMYLPLAAVVVAAVIGMHKLLARAKTWSVATRRQVAIALTVVAALSLGGATYVRNHVYADRILFWNDVLDRRPDSVTAEMGLATEMVMRAEPAAAIEHYDRALEINPDYYEAYALHSAWGGCLLALGRPQEALQHFQESMRLNPRHAPGLLGYGMTLAQLGDSRGALEPLRAGLAIDPRVPKAHAVLATVLARSGDLAAARVEVQKALEIDPNDLLAHMTLADLLVDEGHPDQALREYREVLRLSPGEPRATRQIKALSER